VLLDEVDKAHPDVLTVLLQLFDEVRFGLAVSNVALKMSQCSKFSLGKNYRRTRQNDILQRCHFHYDFKFSQ
jgi:MoxR-like ATPase